MEEQVRDWEKAVAPQQSRSASRVIGWIFIMLKVKRALASG